MTLTLTCVQTRRRSLTNGITISRLSMRYWTTSPGIGCRRLLHCRGCRSSTMKVRATCVGCCVIVAMQSGPKESDWRAGYVSALIFASSAMNQGINIPRSP